MMMIRSSYDNMIDCLLCLAPGFKQTMIVLDLGPFVSSQIVCDGHEWVVATVGPPKCWVWAAHEYITHRSQLSLSHCQQTHSQPTVVSPLRRRRFGCDASCVITVNQQTASQNTGITPKTNNAEKKSNAVVASSGCSQSFQSSGKNQLTNHQKGQRSKNEMGHKPWSA